MRITIVGAGSWGTALAQTLAVAGGDRDVVLCARTEPAAAAIAASRHNPRYLTDVELDQDIEITADIRSALRGAGVVVLALPTNAMRVVAEQAAPHLPADAVVVSAAKGFEGASGARMSQVLGEALSRPGHRITALSGPNIAVEIGRGLPAAGVVAGEASCAALVRDVFTGSRYRAYSTDDVVGVEYAGALKNIIAIAAGICDGIGIGDNGKAAILTRGLAEIARLGIAAGARVMTFAGLAGLGDCVVTCTSPHSRNRRLGESIARGATLEEALQAIGMVVEGVNTTRVTVQLAADHAVDMPITEQVHAVLFERKPVSEALQDLMRRDPAEELHGIELRGLEGRPPAEL
ncbi:MAG TPA: NAD(P)H-dependent glycerol-3-phosphate dehydrogenase [Candidatus Dormibacteraeota bacterium]